MAILNIGKHALKLQPLQLGRHYIVYWQNYGGWKRKMVCKFIQPTKCGYNFLNLETNKCVLPRHLYPSKKHPDQKLFWVNIDLKIEAT